jgi:hypothetical protein
MTKTEMNLPRDKGSDERSAGDAQCPDPQRSAAVSGRIHLLHVRRAQRQRRTHAEALENPSDHDARVRLGDGDPASRNQAFGKREQQDRPSSKPISERVPKQDAKSHHQRVGPHEIGHVGDRLVEELGHLQKRWDERRRAPRGHSGVCDDLEKDEGLDARSPADRKDGRRPIYRRV